MAELKRDFQGAKMNKDLDERLLPPGQYRDANNIQVVTSEGSNVGTVQPIAGNIKLTYVDPLDGDSSTSKCDMVVVGSCNVPEENKIYYFVAGQGYGGSHTKDYGKDYIIEYDTITKLFKYVFVDIFFVRLKGLGAGAAGRLLKTGVGNWTHGVRPGMTVRGTLNSNVVNSYDGVKVKDITHDNTNTTIYLNDTSVQSADSDEVILEAERVLRFHPSVMIDSINYIDGMLFWTDNLNEPRKINIKRCLQGTGGDTPLQNWVNLSGFDQSPQTPSNLIFNYHAVNNPHFHTRLVRRGNFTTFTTAQSSKVIALDRDERGPIWYEEEHITVIKKSPKVPLNLEMYVNKNIKVTDDGIENPISAVTTPMSFADSDGPLEVGTLMYIGFTSDIDLRVNDVLVFTNKPNAHAA